MSGIEKIYATERNVTVFRRKLSISGWRKISLRNTVVYQKSSAIEKFHAYEVDNSFLSWNLFTYTAYKVRWGTPLCFRIFGTSKTFMLSRGVSRFSVVSLALQYWQIAWVTPSTLRKNSGIENFHAKERNITIFRRIFFVSVSKKNVGEHSGISEKFSYQKTSCVRGRYHFSPLFPGLLPIKFVGEPLCVSESLGHQKLSCSVGGGGASWYSVGFCWPPSTENFRE